MRPEVEDDEQERDQVEARVEAHARVVKGRKPGFVRRELLDVRGPVGRRKGAIKSAPPISAAELRPRPAVCNGIRLGMALLFRLRPGGAPQRSTLRPASRAQAEGLSQCSEACKAKESIEPNLVERPPVWRKAAKRRGATS